MIEKFHFWVYPKELKAGICIPMFMAALFTVDKRWNQLKCLWTR